MEGEKLQNWIISDDEEKTENKTRMLLSKREAMNKCSSTQFQLLFSVSTLYNAIAAACKLSIFHMMMSRFGQQQFNVRNGVIQSNWIWSQVNRLCS